MLARLRTAFARGEASDGEGQPDAQLDAVVARQRGIRAAEVQDRLSRQYTDPHSEEAPSPLYGAEVYREGTDPEADPEV